MIDKTPHGIPRLHWFCKPNACLVTLSLSLFAVCLLGEPMPILSSLTRSFDNGSRLEWPHQASKIIAAAPPQDRENLAVALLESIHMNNTAPALLISTVSEIAHATPEVAAAVAAKTVQFQPQFIAAIASAATNAAPDWTAQIMRSMEAAINEAGNQVKPDQVSDGRIPIQPGKLDPRNLIDHSTNQPSHLFKARN